MHPCGATNEGRYTGRSEVNLILLFCVCKCASMSGESRPFSDSMQNSYGATDERARLVSINKKADEMNNRLASSVQMLNEIMDVGQDTLVELNRQREQIERSRDTLNRVDKKIDESNAILTKMSRKWYDPRYWLSSTNN